MEMRAFSGMVVVEYDRSQVELRGSPSSSGPQGSPCLREPLPSTSSLPQHQPLKANFS